jgi:serine/threonine protein kinase
VTWLSNEVVDRLREVATWPELPSDRYVIRGPIGRGGMGTVYAARDELLDRDVALKVSNSAVVESDLEQRLQQEARVLARLEHPGIVPVHDAGILGDGRLFYVMKLVRGRTLTEALDGRRDETLVLSIFERIAETVAFAHAAGIVHRDLKPSNVMVGRFGEVLVLDWGVAKLLGDRPAPAPRAAGARPGAGGTEGGTRIGTPGFMSPEQQRGRQDVGAAADVYSLGALLTWMLAGATPESRDDAIKRLRAVTPTPSKRLIAVAAKCLSADPEDRYADAGALVADLARFRAGEAVTAHRETPLDRVERWFNSYRAAILLVLAYLVMRTLFAVFSR